MKLFNQFRRQLMPGKGFRKYMLYAFGEILLVVIGILIAVNINNWNEQRKKRVQQVDLAEKVRTQMLQDTLNFGKVIRFNKRMKVLFDKVLRDVTPDEPLDCLRCAGLVFGNMNIANMDPKIKTLLNDAELSNDSTGKLLRQIEVAYEDSSAILKLLEESLVANFKSNLDHLLVYEWFAPFLANNDCNEDCMNYFSTSPDFRNRVAYTELIMLKAYDSEVKLFYSEIGEFIKELEPQLTE